MKRLFTLFLLLLLAAPAWSLEVLISGGVEGATPIAVVPFGWSGSGEQPPFNLGKIVAADLKRSGRFRTLDEGDIVARPHVGKEVDYRDWRALKMDHLVVGKLSAKGEGAIRCVLSCLMSIRGNSCWGTT